MEREGVREQQPPAPGGAGPLIPWAGLAGKAALRAPRAAGELARRALDPRENPFLASELRRQARRGSWLVTLLLHGLALSTLFMALLWISAQRWPTFLGQAPHFLRLQLVVGLAALHGWLVVYAADARAREAAQREERMWEMLVVTPLSAAEIVLFKSAYPFLYAGLIALMALPFYVLAAAISGDGLTLLLMLMGVFGLVSIRLVTPLRPFHPRRTRRRPGRSAGAGDFFLRLWAWLWVLSFAGALLVPLSSLAAVLFLTWPVVAATVLPTFYPFFRMSLPPLVVLLALGPPLFVSHLRAAARRLMARVTEAPIAAPPSGLHDGVLLGGALAVLGYAWPWLIEAGSLARWLQLPPDPGTSLGALGWILLAGWCLVHGAGRLFTPPEQERRAEAPRRASGPGGGGPGGFGTVAAFLAPPLAVLGGGCLLAGRLPSPTGLAWLGRSVLVAAGAAALITALQQRLRAATLARQPADVALTWLSAFLLIVLPALVFNWPDPRAIRFAVLSPVVGFLLALPPGSSLQPAGVGALPPWWLTPAANAGAAFLLVRLAPAIRLKEPRPAMRRLPAAVARAPAGPGTAGHWVERFAAWNDNPVLVQELRLSARRFGEHRYLGRASVGAMVGLVALSPAVALLTGTSLGAYAPGGVPLREYLKIVTGLASLVPLRLVPLGLSDFPLFFASVMVLVVIGLSWPVVFGAPIQGAASFARERRKGRLGFLLLTPLTDAEIVQGKLLGGVAPLLLALAVAFPAAAAAALLSLSPAVVWSLLLSFAWLLVACLVGGALGTLASLRLRGEHDPHGLPLLAMLILQGAMLWIAARLQFLFTGEPWVSHGLRITAWYGALLVLLEAGIGWLAYLTSVAALARTRHRDL